jgi:predicted ABC-class ATPase
MTMYSAICPIKVVISSNTTVISPRGRLTSVGLYPFLGAGPVPPIDYGSFLRAQAMDPYRNPIPMSAPGMSRQNDDV